MDLSEDGFAMEVEILSKTLRMNNKIYELPKKPIDYLGSTKKINRLFRVYKKSIGYLGYTKTPINYLGYTKEKQLIF